MRRIIIFAALGAILAFGVWLRVWRYLPGVEHASAAGMVALGGLFTLAIAVLVRD